MDALDITFDIHIDLILVLTINEIVGIFNFLIHFNKNLMWKKKKNLKINATDFMSILLFYAAVTFYL